MSVQRESGKEIHPLPAQTTLWLTKEVSGGLLRGIVSNKTCTFHFNIHYTCRGFDDRGLVSSMNACMNHICIYSGMSFARLPEQWLTCIIMLLITTVPMPKTLCRIRHPCIREWKPWHLFMTQPRIVTLALMETNKWLLCMANMEKKSPDFAWFAVLLWKFCAHVSIQQCKSILTKLKDSCVSRIERNRWITSKLNMWEQNTNLQLTNDMKSQTTVSLFRNKKKNEYPMSESPRHAL